MYVLPLKKIKPPWRTRALTGFPLYVARSFIRFETNFASMGTRPFSRAEIWKQVLCPFASQGIRALVPMLKYPETREELRLLAVRYERLAKYLKRAPDSLLLRRQAG